MHFVEIPPGKSNHGHGHQNEAVFYILKGKGYEIHDDKRYDWEAGDLVVVHTDSVHRHFNDGDETAKALVMKAKSTWMYFGLIQQGRSGRDRERGRVRPARGVGPDLDRGRRRSARRSSSRPTRSGRRHATAEIRVLCSKDTPDVRVFSVDVYEQEIPPGSQSGKHWHMADEVAYVISGAGQSVQWEVEAEIAERYYARVAKEPTRHDFKADDTVYVPQNHVHQYVSTGDEPLRIVVCAEPADQVARLRHGATTSRTRPSTRARARPPRSRARPPPHVGAKVSARLR